MEESILLNPKVKVSALDMSELPLYNFHVVIVVEPDPETWAVPDDEMDKFLELLEMRSELIIDDVLHEFDPDEIMAAQAEDVEETLIIMAGEGMEIIFFGNVEQYSRYIVKSDNYEFENLLVLLDGIAKNHPSWKRIGIVGGVYEDEVIRVANMVQAAGFDATIVTRHCVTKEIFVDLDDMWDAVNAERKRILGIVDELDDDNDLDDDAA